jgi:hypothetical protein
MRGLDLYPMDGDLAKVTRDEEGKYFRGEMLED